MNQSFRFADFVAALKSANPGFLLCAVASAFGFLLFEAAALTVCCRMLGAACPLRKSVVYSAADLYFSAITPSASGGQPASAYLMLGDGISVPVAAAALLANLVMLKQDLPSSVAVAAFALACVIVHMTPTFANAMGMDAIARGSPTNYSLARGMGSLVYSILAYLTGMLVGKYGTSAIPVVGAACAAALIAATIWYHLAGERGLPEAAPKTEETKKAGFLKQYPKFAFFLVGAVFLHFSHNVLSNFMYQIMLSKHGGAGEQGTATAIAALVELPVMFGFPLMLRWMGSDKWVRLCGFGMAIKGLGLFLATTPYGVYAAQATQIIGYGLYAISSVNYASQVVGKGESVRAQSYLGSTTTVGALAALSTGGVICQHFGSQAMVLTSFACAMTGAVIILLAAGGRKKEG